MASPPGVRTFPLRSVWIVGYVGKTTNEQTPDYPQLIFATSRNALKNDGIIVPPYVHEEDILRGFVISREDLERLESTGQATLLPHDQRVQAKKRHVYLLTTPDSGEYIRYEDGDGRLKELGTDLLKEAIQRLDEWQYELAETLLHKASRALIGDPIVRLILRYVVWWQNGHESEILRRIITRKFGRDIVRSTIETHELLSGRADLKHALLFELNRVFDDSASASTVTEAQTALREGVKALQLWDYGMAEEQLARSAHILRDHPLPFLLLRYLYWLRNGEESLALTQHIKTRFGAGIDPLDPRITGPLQNCDRVVAIVCSELELAFDKAESEAGAVALETAAKRIDAVRYADSRTYLRAAAHALPEDPRPVLLHSSVLRYQGMTKQAESLAEKVRRIPHDVVDDYIAKSDEREFPESVVEMMRAEFFALHGRSRKAVTYYVSRARQRVYPQSSHIRKAAAIAGASILFCMAWVTGYNALLARTFRWQEASLDILFKTTVIILWATVLPGAFYFFLRFACYVDRRHRLVDVMLGSLYLSAVVGVILAVVAITTQLVYPSIARITLVFGALTPSALFVIYVPVLMLENRRTRHLWCSVMPSAFRYFKKKEKQLTARNGRAKRFEKALVTSFVASLILAIPPFASMWAPEIVGYIVAVVICAFPVCGLTLSALDATSQDEARKWLEKHQPWIGNAPYVIVPAAVIVIVFVNSAASPFVVNLSAFIAAVASMVTVADCTYWSQLNYVPREGARFWNRVPVLCVVAMSVSDLGTFVVLGLVATNFVEAYTIYFSLAMAGSVLPSGFFVFQSRRCRIAPASIRGTTPPELNDRDELVLRSMPSWRLHNPAEYLPAEVADAGMSYAELEDLIDNLIRIKGVLTSVPLLTKKLVRLSDLTEIAVTLYGRNLWRGWRPYEVKVGVDLGGHRVGVGTRSNLGTTVKQPGG